MNKIYKALILLVCTIVPISVFASEVTASKDTIWTVSNSPYIIEKDIIIEKNDKLIVEPGVTINFKTNSDGVKYKLIVQGILEAKGSSSNPIIFTAETPKAGSWSGIIFEKDSKGIVEYCNIEYAASGVSCFTSSPKINFNNFKINEVAIVCEDRSSPIITNNYITNNGTFQSTAGGIACSLYSNPEIALNTIEKNIGYGIYITTFSSPKIINNKILDNRGRGMVIFSRSTPTVMNNEIARNSCSCGIIVYQSNPIILNNDLHDNRTYGIGVTLGSAPIISNNYIHENGNGIIAITASPTITYNIVKNNKGAGLILWDDASPLINYNNIELKDDSQVIQGGRIALSSINMQNNWWGTTDKAVIEKNILSLVKDENVVGKLDYSNFKDKEISISSFNNSTIYNQNSSDILKSHPWNISGEKIVFVSFRNNNWDIYLTNPLGTDLQNLTKNNLHDVYPIYSPDGKKIVYSSRQNGSLDVCIMDLSDNSSKQITDTITNEEFPTWSPDSKQIAFKQVENLNDYYVIDVDGKNRTRTDVAPEGYHNVLFMWMQTNHGKLALK